MTPRSRTAAVVSLLAAGGAFAALLSFGSGAAQAHDSECHAQQSCPADDGSYVWTDSGGRAWICALAPGGQGEGTIIIYEGQRYACEAAAEPPLPPAEPTPTTPTVPTPTVTTPAPSTQAEPAKKPEPKTGEKQSPRKRAQAPPDDGQQAPLPPFGGFGSPSNARPALDGGPYVFPVLGPVAFVDSFGASRADVSWHHGDDLFAPIGAPVVAIAAGTLFSVGWNDIGGKRLWLRDGDGNEFYYAHLSAFSPIALEGAQVAAGEVVGYVGTTGDARGTPAHLHFEIHPASMLGLGYDGAVNPTPYLESWRRLTEQTAAAIRARSTPRPGAILLSVSDISTASGLQRASIRRAFEGGAMRNATPYLVAGGALGESTQRSEAQVAALEAKLQASAVKFARSSGLFGRELWDALARCEAGGNWTADTGNGYAGGLQFAPSTWRGFGGGDYARSASSASREEQIEVAEIVLAAQGWHAWPTCSRLLGLQ